MAQMKKLIILLLVSVAIYSCESSTYQDIEADTVPVTGNVTYNGNAKAIIDANCVSCHSAGGPASFRPLTNYNEVRAAVLNTNLLSRIQLQNGEVGIMPQGGRMSQANINLILQWNTDGLLEQ